MALGGVKNREKRDRIYRRDGYRCYYCGVRPDLFTIDHVIPLSAGGKSTTDNLVACCLSCNQAKADRIVDIPPPQPLDPPTPPKAKKRRGPRPAPPSEWSVADLITPAQAALLAQLMPATNEGDQP